jgi:Uri superfamily endonuclease
MVFQQKKQERLKNCSKQAWHIDQLSTPLNSAQAPIFAHRVSVIVSANKLFHHRQSFLQGSLRECVRNW